MHTSTHYFFISEYVVLLALMILLSMEFKALQLYVRKMPKCVSCVVIS